LPAAALLALIIMEKLLAKANVLGVVFSFLDIKSLGKLAQVSK